MASLGWLWLSFVTGVSRRAGPSIQHPLPLDLVPHTEALSTNLFDRGRLPAHRCAQNRMAPGSLRGNPSHGPRGIGDGLGDPAEWQPGYR